MVKTVYETTAKDFDKAINEWIRKGYELRDTLVHFPESGSDPVIFYGFLEEPDKESRNIEAISYIQDELDQAVARNTFGDSVAAVILRRLLEKLA